MDTFTDCSQVLIIWEPPAIIRDESLHCRMGMDERQRGEETGYHAHHLLPKFHGEGFAGNELA